ncbi:dethiobiotin synthase [Hyphomicrobium sp. D-2]|uniref:dethiobiotin synthase n=1 Tax=Hyphomicrobium sp. D-2 TaxID=3041621 RepID=UPI002455D006|nr:dethiobiotin synthase [Hyphomicrobium sp. D-2]MDH4983576.1 dethiobiotin synthase [Hyphomicrobium sp. D-2]
MSATIVVTGTDTGIGKTVFSAALVAALDGAYWKPVQAGLSGPTDSDTVRRLAAADRENILPETYRLKTPASPHLAAERDGIEIDVETLSAVPATPGGAPLIIEGAGGLMVPLRRDYLQLDLYARWKLPVVLVASTRLGTINHSLLSIEALQRRGVPLLGVAFIGDSMSDSENTIVTMGGTRRLGRLPHLDELSPASLSAAFAANFRIADFIATAPAAPPSSAHPSTP